MRVSISDTAHMAIWQRSFHYVKQCVVACMIKANFFWRYEVQSPLNIDANTEVSRLACQQKNWNIPNLLCVLCGFQAWSHTQYSVCEGISEQVPTVVWLRWCSCSYNIASFPGSPHAFPYSKWRKAGQGLRTRLVITQEKQSVLCLCQPLF